MLTFHHDLPEAKLEDVFRKNSEALEQLQQKLGSSHQAAAKEIIGGYSPNDELGG